MYETFLAVLSLVCGYVVFDFCDKIAPRNMGRYVLKRIATKLPSSIRREVYYAFKGDYYSLESSLHKYILAASMMMTVRDLAAPKSVK